MGDPDAEAVGVHHAVERCRQRGCPPARRASRYFGLVGKVRRNLPEDCVVQREGHAMLVQQGKLVDDAVVVNEFVEDVFAISVVLVWSRSTEPSQGAVYRTQEG